MNGPHPMILRPGLFARLRALAHEAPFVLVAAGYSLLFVTLNELQRQQPTAAGGVFYSFGFIPLNLGAAWALVHPTLRPRFDPDVRAGLRWIAAGLVMIGIGNTAWFIETRLGRDPTLSLFNLFYLASYPLFYYGLFQFPRARRRRLEWWKLALDAAIVVVGLAVVIWSLVVQKVMPAYGDGFAAFIGLSYPAGDLVTLGLATELTLRGRPGPSRTAFRLLLLGLAVNAGADLAYQVVFMENQGAVPAWTDPLYALSYLFMIASGAYYRRGPVLPATTGPESVAEYQPPSQLPLYVLASLALLLCWVALAEWPGVLSVLSLGLVVVVALLLVREALAVAENVSLLAERAARQSEVRFESLVRHSTDLVLLADLEGIVRFASPAVQQVLGQSPEQVVGLPVAELLHPDDQERGERFLLDLTLQPGRSATIRWRMHHAGGEWRSFESVVTNLLREPEVGGVVLNCRDLTERELLEEQLRQAQKMEAIGRLAGGVAHDFNNILTTVLASTDLALGNTPPDHPARADLDEIRHSAIRAAALTRQLLAFGRRQLIEPEVHDLRRVTEETLRLVSRLLGARVTLETELTATGAMVRVDRSQVEQILLNLAANARDAMPSGGTLRIRVRDLVLGAPLVTRFMAVPIGAYAVLEVEDSGAGIDPETLPRIFEPFFTTKGQGKGTGLGLASVYGIVRQNGGFITAESSVGQGTRFRIFFPLVDAVAATAPPAAAPDPARGSEDILVVEDEAALLKAAQRILEAAGYQVIGAHNAQEAEAVMAGRETPVDLVLTDVIMPGASGPMLAERLRRRWPGIRILYMSGYPGDELGAHGILDPDTALLQKPFTAQELLVAVRAALAAPGSPAAG